MSQLNRIEVAAQFYYCSGRKGETNADLIRVDLTDGNFAVMSKTRLSERSDVIKNLIGQLPIRRTRALNLDDVELTSSGTRWTNDKEDASKLIALAVGSKQLSYMYPTDERRTQHFLVTA